MAVVSIMFIIVAIVNSINGQYHGILINGFYGTQLYDPFNTPHARGDLELGLQTGANANYGATVISSQLAYFASGNAGGIEKLKK